MLNAKVHSESTHASARVGVDGDRRSLAIAAGISGEGPRQRPLFSAAMATLVATLTGCTQGPYPMGPGFPAGNPWGPTPTANVATVDAQVADLQRRVQLLDNDNRQLQTQLAQSEQQTLVYREELNLIRQQLADTTQRLEEARMVASRANQQFQGLQASTQFRGGATLEANTNIRQVADALRAAGLPVVYEADAARVIVPSDQLFQPGTAILLPQATGMLTPLAAQIARLAPRQKIGIEGFSDDAPLYGGAFTSHHEMTSAQALAVADLLVTRGGLPRESLTAVGHGSTRPRQNNDSAVGRAGNRRVEIVILPDTQ